MFLFNGNFSIFYITEVAHLSKEAVACNIAIIAWKEAEKALGDNLGYANKKYFHNTCSAFFRWMINVIISGSTWDYF